MNDLSVSVSAASGSVPQVALPEAPPKVTARGLNFYYGEHHALKNINLALGIGPPCPPGPERRGVLHRRGQVEDHRAQSRVPAAEGDREEAVRAADIQHVLRALRHRSPPHDSGAHVRRWRASPAVDPPFFGLSPPWKSIGSPVRTNSPTCSR